jgi:hypothetical protein
MESYDRCRFHPVPTRPVFLSRDGSFPGAEETGNASGGTAGLGEPGTPGPSAVEDIPTPAPEASGGWRANSDRRKRTGASGSESSLWPLTELKLGRAAQDPGGSGSAENDVTR